MHPFVSVIIPCRNEAAFLGACLDSVLASDYPPDRLEIVVADGMSTDGTRELLGRYASGAGTVALRMVDNPARVTPAALNRAIAESRGDVIVRIDAHSTIAPDYISRAVGHLESTGADSVGGPWHIVPRDNGPFAKAIALVLGHTFGVGNASYRTGVSEANELRWVDTVWGGCWRREIFARVGLFNESLARSQDMEFNQRVGRAGGRILLAPDVHSNYYARAAFGSFCRHNFVNGVWAVLPFAYADGIPVRWRHLAPMAFAGSLGISACGALAGWPWALLATAAPYAMVTALVSLSIAWREGDPKLAVFLPITFASLHLAYGAGSLWGAVRLARILFARLVRTTGESIS